MKVMWVLLSYRWKIKLSFYPFYLDVSEMIRALRVFSDIFVPLLALVTFVTSLVWFRMGCAECYRSVRGVKQRLVSW